MENLMIAGVFLVGYFVLPVIQAYSRNEMIVGPATPFLLATGCALFAAGWIHG